MIKKVSVLLLLCISSFILIGCELDDQSHTLDVQLWKESREAADIDYDGDIDADDYDSYLIITNYQDWKESDLYIDMNDDGEINQEDRSLSLYKNYRYYWWNYGARIDIDGNGLVQPEDYELFRVLNYQDVWEASEYYYDYNKDGSINDTDLEYIVYKSYQGLWSGSDIKVDYNQDEVIDMLDHDIFKNIHFYEVWLESDASSDLNEDNVIDENDHQLYIDTEPYIIVVETPEPLKVGMDLRWPPFEGVDNEGIPEGISVDIALELGEYLGREVEIVNIEFGSLIPALQNDEIDVIIGTMSITDERSEVISFSNPYMWFPMITLMNKDFYNENGPETKEELFGITEEVIYTGVLNMFSTILPLSEATNPTILEQTNMGLAFQAVITGEADALILSVEPIHSVYIENQETTTILWDPVVSSPIGMGVRQEDTELLQEINGFIATFEGNFNMYDQLLDKYYCIFGEGSTCVSLELYLEE